MVPLKNKEMVKLLFDRTEQFIFFHEFQMFPPNLFENQNLQKNAKMNIYFHQKVKKLSGKNNYK